MAVLHLVWDRSACLRELLAAGLTCLALAGCDPPDPSLQPDETLQVELGLTVRDEVHRVTLTGGQFERADPAALSIGLGAHVEFVTADWLIHEVIFEEDSVPPEAWTFLTRTDQAASPPLIDRDTRYVVSFEEAPPGRYPYVLEGNGAPGRGVIVVREPEPR
jgi:plastocyanin